MCCSNSSLKNIHSVGFHIWCSAVFSPNKPSNSSLPVYSGMEVPSTPRWKDPGRKNTLFGKASHAKVWYFCFNQVMQIPLAGLQENMDLHENLTRVPKSDPAKILLNLRKWSITECDCRFFRLFLLGCIYIEVLEMFKAQRIWKQGQTTPLSVPTGAKSRNTLFMKTFHISTQIQILDICFQALGFEMPH